MIGGLMEYLTCIFCVLASQTFGQTNPSGRLKKSVFIRPVRCCGSFFKYVYDYK